MTAKRIDGALIIPALQALSCRFEPAGGRIACTSL
jgi:hypothetical protein